LPKDEIGLAQGFARLFLQSLCQTNHLFFRARGNYIHSPLPVKGFFETRLFLFSSNRFSFLTVLDSEA